MANGFAPPSSFTAGGGIMPEQHPRGTLAFVGQHAPSLIPAATQAGYAEHWVPLTPATGLVGGGELMLGSLMGAMVGTSGSSAGKTVGTWGILGEAPRTNPELPPSVISPALSRSAESGTVSPLLLSLTGWGTLAAGGSSAPPPQDAGPETVAENRGGAARALDSEPVTMQPPSGQKLKWAQPGMFLQRSWHAEALRSLLRSVPIIL